MFHINGSIKKAPVWSKLSKSFVGRCKVNCCRIDMERVCVASPEVPLYLDLQSTYSLLTDLSELVETSLRSALVFSSITSELNDGPLLKIY